MRARLVVAAALSGIGVMVALALVVFQFGVRRPSPPLLAKDPNPAIPGAVLYRKDSACLVRAPASGDGPVRELCLPIVDRYGPMAWWTENTVVFADGPVLVAYDLETGESVPPPAGSFPTDTMKLGMDTATSPGGDVARVDVDGRLFVITGTRQTEIARFDTEGYRVRVLLWSPDSQWILLLYQPPRGGYTAELWVVSRDGKTKGTLVQDAWPPGWASWRIEGVGVTPALGAR